MIMQKVIQRMVTAMIHCNGYETFFFSGKLSEFWIFFHLLFHMLNISISQSSQNLLESSVELLQMVR